MEITAKLVSGAGQIVATRIFSAKEAVQSKDEAEAARALNAAFGSVERSLLDWTRSTLASARAKEASESGKEASDGGKGGHAGHKR